MVDFDVILEMDWLASCYAIVDCHNKTANFSILGEPSFSFQGNQSVAPNNLISMFGAWRLLQKRCQGYLALVKDVSKEAPSLDRVPMVREFLDVFLEELPRLPPDRDIEFSIDMVPGT